MRSLGEKIRFLRKKNNVSQEVLADYLGVSFQAVSKWENGITMPDIMMIPAIAAFFRVSTDELFDFNLFEQEKQVREICLKAIKCRDNEPQKAEKILRDGLKRFPGNDIILNNLLCVLDYKDQADETISICKSLIESTKDDEVKYDACRILAMCYKENGQYDLIKPTLEKIPEIYFTKLEVMATLLDDNDGYVAAHRQKNLSAESLIDMLIVVAKHLQKKEEMQKAKIQLDIALKVIDAFQADYAEQELFKSTVLEYMEEQKIVIENLLQR